MLLACGTERGCKGAWASRGLLRKGGRDITAKEESNDWKVREIPAEGTDSAKALRQEGAWFVGEESAKGRGGQGD